MNLCSTIFALNNEYYILSYIDVNEELSKEFILNGINHVLDHIPSLKQTIVVENNKTYFRNIENFNIHKCFTIKYMKNFNIYIKKLMNQSFSEYKFNVVACINTKTHKSRIYFKLHHAYADGYKIIQMVHLFFSNPAPSLPTFKRTTPNSMYYYVIGTMMLIAINILILFKVIINWFLPKPDNKHKPTDYILCKSFNLNKIKKFTTKNNITINDFLYALMVKTDYLYTKQERLLQTMSPINAYHLNECNNMLPIYNIIHNAYDNSSMLKQIHSMFNHYKYSLYITLVTLYTNTITYIHKHIVAFPNSQLQFWYDMVMKSSDYVYTNIVGPNIDNITNIHFLINPINNEIIYNIVSSNNNINLICSFKEGIIQDKKLYTQCIYKAYDDLIEEKI